MSHLKDSTCGRNISSPAHRVWRWFIDMWQYFSSSCCHGANSPLSDQQQQQQLCDLGLNFICFCNWARRSTSRASSAPLTDLLGGGGGHVYSTDHNNINKPFLGWGSNNDWITFSCCCVNGTDNRSQQLLQEWTRLVLPSNGLRTRVRPYAVALGSGFLLVHAGIQLGVCWRSKSK